MPNQSAPLTSLREMFRAGHTRREALLLGGSLTAGLAASRPAVAAAARNWQTSAESMCLDRVESAFPDDLACLRRWMHLPVGADACADTWDQFGVLRHGSGAWTKLASCNVCSCAGSDVLWLDYLIETQLDQGSPCDELDLVVGGGRLWALVQHVTMQLRYTGPRQGPIGQHVGVFCLLTDDVPVVSGYFEGVNGLNSNSDSASVCCDAVLGTGTMTGVDVIDKVSTGVCTFGASYQFRLEAVSSFVDWCKAGKTTNIEDTLRGWQFGLAGIASCPCGKLR